MKRETTLFLVLAGLLLLLSACSNGGGGNTPPETGKPVHLVTTSDCSSLEQRIKDELKKRYERQDTRYLYGDMVMSAADLNGTAQPTTGQESGTYSTTNLQEKGVDEGDLVKTDGASIYLARGSHFLVLKARPAAATAVISDIDLQEQISELYLAEGKVLVTTAAYAVEPPASVSGLLPDIMPKGKSVTRLRIYDISTPAKPSILARYDFPGSLQGSRRIGQTFYLVTNHSIDIPAPVYPWEYLNGGDRSDYDAAVTRARDENLQQIESMTLADMIPTYSQTLYSGEMADTTQTATAAGCGDIYYPENGNGTDLSLVFSVDISPETPSVASSAVFTSWSRLYMSSESLYLASDNNWNWIAPLASTTETLSNPEPTTALHKFSLAASPAKPVYRGSGAVPGWLNDQFSMGEHNGNLRIGTTRGGWWGEDISNRLTILAEQNGSLVETGKIDGIAAGERIYSMRFDRDRGYMVTFRQTDPLFSLDLSDPTDPKIAGEIHVTGFSTYIHLLEGDRLLTIGRSADASGRVTGNKLQIFDASSLAHPRLVGEFELGTGWSSAQYDYHAFLYYDPLSLLALPFSGDFSGTTSGSGLRLFSIDAATGISDRGFIPAKKVATSSGTYQDSIDRAVIIGTDIYSIGQSSLSVNALDTLLLEASLDLPGSSSFYPMIMKSAARPAPVATKRF
jgi:uncharacterized secreted protein with C-terminal beta-propeller domain